MLTQLQPKETEENTAFIYNFFNYICVGVCVKKNKRKKSFVSLEIEEIQDYESNKIYLCIIIEDIIVFNNLCNFFWESLGKTHFRWIFYSIFLISDIQFELIAKPKLLTDLYFSL